MPSLDWEIKMKIEFQTNKYDISLQTRSARIHSLLSDKPELVDKLKAVIAAVLDNFDYVVTKDT